jgi:glycerol kinase
MLDVCTGATAPTAADRSPHGTFPIVAWTGTGAPRWGVEAIMLSAGTNVEWLRDDMGLLDTAAQSHDVAATCATTDGVVYVPALLGLGTPHWDYGARGTLLGLTRGSERRHIVRAVLEGVAHRGADLVGAAEAETGLTIPELRVDGGMSDNPTFVQALADATCKPVAVAPIVEATTLGAGFLAGVASGVWSSLAEAAGHAAPRAIIDPSGCLDRAQWERAISRTTAWIPELSALDF